MRGRAAIIALAAVAVVIAFATRGGDGGGRDGTPTRPQTGDAGAPAAPQLRVGFVYSPEKAALLKPLVARYNAESHRSGDATVQVDGRVVSSGEATDAIAAQRLKPVVWSP